MNRRTILKSALALLGVGAVAKGVHVACARFWLGSFSSCLPRIKGVFDGCQEMVVLINALSLAGAFVEVRLPAAKARGRLYVDRCSAA